MNISLNIKDMSLKEKLMAMEALWYDLSQNEEKRNSPEWHRDVLSERTRIMESGTAEYLTLDELKNNK